MQPIVIRGGGDIASGTIARLCRAGYCVIVLECAYPTAIRRDVAFSEVIYKNQIPGAGNTVTLEGVTMHLAEDVETALEEVSPLHPQMLIDESAESIPVIKPEILVDAIIAKKNLGTTIDMAPLTIALGPGFYAGRDVKYVIETMRGHTLGKIIRDGDSIPNTGVPGIISGYGKERVIHAPKAGILHNVCDIADFVEKGQVISVIESDGEQIEVTATLTGILRGILPDGMKIPCGIKMADIDPRKTQISNCFSISDKSRCIAGSVLELVCAYEKGVLL